MRIWIIREINFKEVCLCVFMVKTNHFCETKIITFKNNRHWNAVQVLCISILMNFSVEQVSSKTIIITNLFSSWKRFLKICIWWFIFRPDFLQQIQLWDLKALFLILFLLFHTVSKHVFFVLRFFILSRKAAILNPA